MKNKGKAKSIEVKHFILGVIVVVILFGSWWYIGKPYFALQIMLSLYLINIAVSYYHSGNKYKRIIACILCPLVLISWVFLIPRKVKRDIARLEEQ